MKKIVNLHFTNTKIVFFNILSKIWVNLSISYCFQCLWRLWCFDYSSDVCEINYIFKEQRNRKQKRTAQSNQMIRSTNSKPFTVLYFQIFEIFPSFAVSYQDFPYRNLEILFKDILQRNLFHPPFFFSISNFNFMFTKCASFWSTSKRTLFIFDCSVRF